MGVRIVVVDNKRGVQDLFAFKFGDAGWETFSYDYAHINLAVLKEIQPDLIIVDIDFHDSGPGWELLQLLKMEDTIAQIPVVVTTPPFLLSAEIRSYLLTHFIQLVNSPIDFPPLLLLIQKTLDMARQAHTLFSSNSLLPILLVEDSADLREALTFALIMERYRVVGAPNGLVALEAVYHAEYSLILLDIVMPVLDGYGFLNAYKQQLRPHTPVIVISGKTDIAGETFPPFVIDVVPKPLRMEHLFQTISKYAHLA